MIYSELYTTVNLQILMQTPIRDLLIFFCYFHREDYFFSLLVTLFIFLVLSVADGEGCHGTHI